MIPMIVIHHLMRPISRADAITLTIRIGRPERWVHKTQLEHIYSVLLRPIIQLLPIDALVTGCICDGKAAGFCPLECDEAYIAVAHSGLADEVQTMLCKESEKLLDFRRD